MHYLFERVDYLAVLVSHLWFSILILLLDPGTDRPRLHETSVDQSGVVVSQGHLVVLVPLVEHPFLLLDDVFHVVDALVVLFDGLTVPHVPQVDVA